MTQIPEERPVAEPAPTPSGAAETPDESRGESPNARIGINNGDVGNQQNAGTINNNYFRGKHRRPVRELLQRLPRLSASLHAYRHPLHDEIVKELEEHRIVVLTSDRDAAFVAGHALANDPN
ncbi:MAG TPA: hypothetical protein VF883_18825, partial [Thermoanaerobaculia bacterium]